MRTFRHQFNLSANLRLCEDAELVSGIAFLRERRRCSCQRLRYYYWYFLFNLAGRMLIWVCQEVKNHPLIYYHLYSATFVEIFGSIFMVSELERSINLWIYSGMIYLILFSKDPCWILKAWINHYVDLNNYSNRDEFDLVSRFLSKWCDTCPNQID